MRVVVIVCDAVAGLAQGGKVVPGRARLDTVSAVVNEDAVEIVAEQINGTQGSELGLRYERAVNVSQGGAVGRWSKGTVVDVEGIDNGIGIVEGGGVE